MHESAAQRRPMGARLLALATPEDASQSDDRRINIVRLTIASVLSLALAAGVAWGLYVLVDGGQLSLTLRALGRRPDLVLVFVATYLGAFSLRAVAWNWLLTHQRPFGTLLGILHVSLFANHVLPAKPGDVIRGWLLYRTGVPAAESGVTTVASRLLDVAALVLLLVVLGPLVVTDSGFVGPIVASAAGVAALAVAIAAIPRLPARLVDRLPTLVGRAVRATAGAAGALPRRKAVGSLFLLVLPSWMLEAGVLWSVAQAAGAPVGVPEAIAVTAFTIVFQAVQVTPGNIGVYEATMTAGLVAVGVPAETALVLAAVTHALKFVYSYVGGVVVMGTHGVRAGLRWVRDHRRVAAGSVEIVAARAWNVLNEGKPFTIVFSTGVFLLVWLAGGLGPVSIAEVARGIALATPLALVWYRFDFPLGLRAFLWGFVGLFVVCFGPPSLALVATALVLYLLFTVVLWGSVYYHLRIGTPLSNVLRFWKLVLENPDTTSANFLEQMPKVVLLTSTAALGALGPAAGGASILAICGFTSAVAAISLFAHRWLFTWRPHLPTTPRPIEAPEVAPARRVLMIVIDGCRLDRLEEARTPTLDRLAREGLWCTGMETVYPARTVTGFSSMLAGAPPQVHGLRSNFVPRLGVRCESVFTVLRRSGRRGTLVGIAHLVDAFGEDVRAVTAVQHNDRIDPSLIEEAKRELLEHDPDLLVLQLLSVDQTGHARGSYREEYLEKIEVTDGLIGGFLEWAGEAGFLDGTTVIVTADHGQGKGVGGHGHLGPGERSVPFLMWGAGVPSGAVLEDTRSLTDVAPTVTWLLGERSPAQSVGRPMVGPPAGPRPLAVIIPAHNETRNLPDVLRAIPDDLGPTEVIVVDDASTDDTAAVAAAQGASIVSLGWRHGLGAALRAGLEAARRVDPWAAVYLDADGEYDPREIPSLLAPIRSGEADYVLGSRFAGSIDSMRPSRRIGNRCFTWLLSAMAARRISDGQTGFRAFGPDALAVAEIVHDYNYAQVLTLDLLSKGLRLAEVPITYRRRTEGRSFVRIDYLWRVPVGIARELITP
jgi:uncharacterized membrane protein YbhN (UPF0104 family)